MKENIHPRRQLSRGTGAGFPFMVMLKPFAILSAFFACIFPWPALGDKATVEVGVRLDTGGFKTVTMTGPGGSVNHFEGDSATSYAAWDAFVYQGVTYQLSAYCPDFTIAEGGGGIAPSCLESLPITTPVLSQGGHRLTFFDTIKPKAPLFLWNQSKSGRYTLVADGHSQAVPSGLNLASLTWQIAWGTNLNCQIDPSSGVVTASTNTGTIIVKATLNGGTCYEEMLDLVPKDCGSCDQGNCPVAAKIGNSVDVKINLGWSLLGDTAGFLQVYSAGPENIAATPAQLRYDFLRAEADVKRDSSNWIKQIKAPDLLANVAVNNGSNYAVQLYSPTNVLLLTNGIYQLTNSPYATITFQNPDNTNHLQVTFTREDTNVFDYYWISNGWKMVSGGGLKTEIKTETVSETNTLRTALYTVQDGTNAAVYQTSEKYRFLGTNVGERLIEQVIGTGANAQSNSFTYYTNGFVEKAIYSDGRWEWSFYDSQNRPTNVFSGFGNQGPTTDSSVCRMFAYTYTTNVISGAGDTGYLETTVPRQTTEYLLGSEISRSYLVALPGERHIIQCVTAGASWNDGSNLVTTNTYFTNGFYQNEIQSETRPDGTMDYYIYDAITISSDNLNRTNVILSGHPDGSGTNIDDGTKTVLIYDSFGKLLSKTVSDIASSGIVIASESYQYDGYKRLTSTTYLDGTSVQNSYQDCCNASTTTDRDGTVTTFGYDALKRLLTTTRNSVTVSNVYDAYGNLLRTVRYGSNGNAITQNISTYDDAGRLTSSRDALGNTNSFSDVLDSNSRRVRTTTFPNNSTRIETYGRDGALLSISGTGVHQTNYLYGVDGDGPYMLEVRLDANGGTNEWTKTSIDSAHRPYKQLYASASGTPSSISYFNNRGQLTNHIDPDGVSTIYIYNAKGERTHKILDADQDHVIDFSGDDRIIMATNDVTSDHGSYVFRRQTYAWDTSVDSPKLIATDETSVDGLKSWHTIWNSGTAVTSSNATVFDPAHGYRLQTSAASEGTYTVTTNQYGRAISVTSRDANGSQIGQMIYGFDAHDRPNSATDARNGATTFSYNDADQISGTVTPLSQLTTNYFDSMGRIWKTTLPDATSVTNDFYLTGELRATTGSRTYPTGFGYDGQGRLKTMTNWTAYPSTGARVTTWNYDAYRGFLTNKVYADGKGPVYAYTSAGRLSARTWARGTNTTYSYSALGDLAAVTYSSGANNLSFGYDRRGRRTSITNGTDVTSVVLNDAGLLLSEAYSGGALDGLKVTNAYDSFLRRITNGVLTSSSTWLVLSTNSFDAASRLSVVSDLTNSATYAYVTDSPLVSTITFKQSGTTRLTTTKSYDFVNRLTQISNAPSADSPLAFNYGYNSANQRTTMTLADNSQWRYSYDTLGQVTSGKRFWSDGTYVAGQQFEYAFDDIGNRKSAASGGDQWGANLRYENYTVNNLNQYTQRTVPASVDIIGAANSNATVTANLLRASRKGDYFRVDYKLNNKTGAVYQSITNVAVLGGDGDTVATNTGSILIPQTPEAFVYDLDGTLTTNGLWIFTWDADNRLIGQDPASGVPDSAKKSLRFSYDSESRRISKVVSNWNGSAWTIASNLRFIYDGWNLLADLNATNDAVVCSYTWGIDLSGSFQGAGGIGGLLAVTESGRGAHFAEFDGNGNVAGLIAATGGTNSAIYEYGPFGETRHVFGAAASANPFRFSTKVQDLESDMLYYGFRYLNVGGGTWLGRDPMQEEGRLSLAGFVGNNPVDFVDVLGLYQEAGHFYSVYAVAIAKGYSTREAYRLAYFAQLPDEIGEYSAWENLWQWGTERALQNQWLHDVQQIIHSLHGGDVAARRSCLRNLLQDPTLKPIDRGLLLHAFGDSYAHTYADSETGEEKAYGYPYGHGKAGEGPDLPALRPALYKDYINDVFKALPDGPLSPNPSLVAEIIQQNNNLSALPDPYRAQNKLIDFIIKRSGYINSYRPEKGNYSSNPPVGADDLGPLTNERVQQFIDFVKKGCCKK